MPPIFHLGQKLKIFRKTEKRKPNSPPSKNGGIKKEKHFYRLSQNINYWVCDWPAIGNIGGSVKFMVWPGDSNLFYQPPFLTLFVVFFIREINIIRTNDFRFIKLQTPYRLLLNDYRVIGGFHVMLF